MCYKSLNEGWTETTMGFEIQEGMASPPTQVRSLSVGDMEINRQIKPTSRYGYHMANSMVKTRKFGEQSQYVSNNNFSARNQPEIRQNHGWRSREEFY